MKNKKIELSIYLLYLLIVIIISLIIINLLSLTRNNKSSNDFNLYKTSLQNKYQLISPLLDCGDQNFSDLKINSLKTKLERFVHESKDNQKINHVSVYFRDLNNGPWFGYNEKEKFSPASLMKVPLLMAYLKLAENDKEILNKKLIAVSFDSLADQNIEPRKTIEAGKEYQVNDLLERMIIYSDNAAAQTLLNNNENVAKELDFIYNDLGFDLLSWDDEDYENYMTVKEYSSFFRILYNSSYLNREMSEKALKLLTKTDYDAGLKAGVDKNILVAHKFGERVIFNTKQLHDCGIVYQAENPYLLCVMTRGDDLGEMRELIKNISELFYNNLK